MSAGSREKIENSPGRLTRDKFGFSMPADAESYKRPPSYMRDMESVIITYETDEEMALDLLPEADELRLCYPVTAKLMFVRMPYTSWGSYNECYQALDCTWDGRPCMYPVRLLVDSDIGMMIGRELWGNPKKFGTIEFSRESNIIQCVGERPRGNRICTGLVRLDQPIDIPPVDVDVLGFRVIPNPENLDEFSIAELLMNRLHVVTKSAWSGDGSLIYNCESKLDPWYKLPVRKIVSCVHTISDVDTSPTSKIIKKY